MAHTNNKKPSTATPKPKKPTYSMAARRSAPGTGGMKLRRRDKKKSTKASDEKNENSE